MILAPPSAYPTSQNEEDREQIGVLENSTSCLSDPPAGCRLPINLEVATITPVAFLQK